MAAIFQTHPQLSGIIMAGFPRVPIYSHRDCPQALLNFLRRYSDGRQPIHFVNALENTNGFW